MCIHPAGLPALLAYSTLPHARALSETHSVWRQTTLNTLPVPNRKGGPERNGGSMRWSCLPKDTRVVQVERGFQVLVQSTFHDTIMQFISLPSPLTIHPPTQCISEGPGFPGLGLPLTAESWQAPQLPVAPPQPTWRRHGGRRSWSHCSPPRSPVASAGAQGRYWLWCWGSLLPRSRACPHTGYSRPHCWHLVPEGQG